MSLKISWGRNCPVARPIAFLRLGVQGRQSKKMAQNALSGSEVLLQSDHQYLVWETASGSTKRWDMLKSWGTFHLYPPWLRLYSHHIS